ncbi:hypothetical protein RI367_000346 [Sorochytrium milnesiophthora]
MPATRTSSSGNNARNSQSVAHKAASVHVTRRRAFPRKHVSLRKYRRPQKRADKQSGYRASTTAPQPPPPLPQRPEEEEEEEEPEEQEDDEDEEDEGDGGQLQSEDGTAATPGALQQTPVDAATGDVVDVAENGDDDDAWQEQQEAPQRHHGTDDVDSLLPPTTLPSSRIIVKDTYYIALTHALRSAVLKRDVVSATALLRALCSFRLVPIEMVWKYTLSILRAPESAGVGAYQHTQFLRSLAAAAADNDKSLSEAINLELTHHLIAQGDADQMLEAYDHLEPLTQLIEYSQNAQAMKTLADVSYVLWCREMQRATALGGSHSQASQSRRSFMYDSNSLTQSQNTQSRSTSTNRARRFYTTAERCYGKLFGMLDPDMQLESLPHYVNLMLERYETGAGGTGVHESPALSLAGASHTRSSQRSRMSTSFSQSNENEGEISANAEKAKSFLVRYIWSSQYESDLSDNAALAQSDRPLARCASALRLLLSFLDDHFPGDALKMPLLERLLEVDPEVDWHTFYVPYIEHCVRNADELTSPAAVPTEVPDHFLRALEVLAQRIDWAQANTRLPPDGPQAVNDAIELFRALADLLYLLGLRFQLDVRKLWPYRRAWWCRFLFPDQFVHTQRKQSRAPASSIMHTAAGMQEQHHALTLKLLKALVCILLRVDEYPRIRRPLWQHDSAFLGLQTTVETLSQGTTSSQRWSSLRGKDMQNLRDYCSAIQSLSVQQRRIISLKKLSDLNELRDLMDKAEDDDLIAHFDTEALAAIINPGVRAQVLKSRLMARMSDEKELSSVVQQHKDDFAQMIWKRRLAVKRDLRELFQIGPGVIGKFGEVVSDVSLDIIQSLERHYSILLCKNAIHWGLSDNEDIPGAISRSAVLLAPSSSQIVQVSTSRLEFSLLPSKSKDDAGWGCVYASHGLWSNRLLSRPLQLELVIQTEMSIERMTKEASNNMSFLHLIARMVDAIHPGFQLQAAVLAYPLYSVSILKRRLVQLGYEVGGAPAASSSSGAIDTNAIAANLTTAGNRITGQNALDITCRFYFEFACHGKPLWRVGFRAMMHMSVSQDRGYPGEDATSFGFSYDGQIYYDGAAYPQPALIKDPAHHAHHSKEAVATPGEHVYGIIVDLFRGSISLVIDGREQMVAFGSGSDAFNRATQVTQALDVENMGSAGHHHPKAADKQEIRVNFGSQPFVHGEVHALPYTQLLQQTHINSADGIAVLATPAEEGKETINQEEEEKLQLALEKNYFRASMSSESERCWSQFPPSVYRRSLASTKIQRVWRIYRGRKWRRQMREQQWIAATKIQRMARRALVKIRAVKNKAALVIQRNWRAKCFIWIALLRWRYQKPLWQLHRAAHVIQRRYRSWVKLRNSPMVNQYNARLEDLATAVNKIIAWWRPRHARMLQRRKLEQRYKAVTDIQRVWRGHCLRKLIRPDLRQKLQTLGEHLARHRHDLLRIQAAYAIQEAWRAHRVRKVRTEKLRMRNTAATRVQALWKGFWVRSHINVRFNYGESLFLNAVSKALRNCHFIPKMYRPCGIVCPKRERHKFVPEQFMNM